MHYNNETSDVKRGREERIPTGIYMCILANSDAVIFMNEAYT